jgi:hypothetical protein
MGLSIWIGDFDTLGNEEATWTIELPDAPPLGACGARSNHRAPSYSAWASFCRATRLQSLFDDPTTGLMRQHPGVEVITPEHYHLIRSARAAFTARHPNATIEGERTVDEHLARLLWLEWWTVWAVAHCAVPALRNS